MIVNNSKADINGTSLMGHVKATYTELRLCFGMPVMFETDKSTAEWRLEAGGQVVTIYDYHSSGMTGLPYDWHVGGKTPEAVDIVDEALLQHRKTA
jgi:hypothetical protein